MECLKGSTHTHIQMYVLVVVVLHTNTDATAGNCVALKESEVAPNLPVIATFDCRHNKNYNNNSTRIAVFVLVALALRLTSHQLE